VTIEETNDARGAPQVITVRARGSDLNVQIRFDVEAAVTTRGTGSASAAGSGPLGSGLDFLQLRGTYTVTGHAGARTLKFSAPGSAETFRGTTEARNAFRAR
jgi:hypothetical protein